jgi:hypothetical protein
MSIQRGLELGSHSLELTRRQPKAFALGSDKSINPFVVKRIEFERVLGGIHIAAEVVARMTRDARYHARSGAAGRADD